MNTILRDPIPCPYCGEKQDALTHTTEDDAAPSPGDFTICLSCGEVAVFDDNLHERKMSDEEAKELRAERDQDPKLDLQISLVRACAMAQKAQKRRGENSRACDRMRGLFG